MNKMPKEHFPEQLILQRYERNLFKKPLHVLLQSLERATADQVRRCLSGNASNYLANVFSEEAGKVPETDFTSFEKGRVEFYNGNYPAALLELTKAYESGEKKAAGFIGSIYLNYYDDFDKAMPFLTEAAANGDVELYGVIGEYLEQKEKVMEAIGYYEMEVKAGTLQHYKNLGELYECTDQPAKAADLYRKAFEAGNDDAFYLMLHIHREMGDEREFLNEILQTSDESKKRVIQFLKGGFLYLHGKGYKNIDLVNEGLETMKNHVPDNDPERFEVLYKILLQEGRQKEAMELVKKKVEEGEKLEHMLAESYLKEQEIDKAQEMAALGIKRGNHECCYLLGAALDIKKEHRAAESAYQEAIKNCDQRAYLNMASLYGREGDIKQAREYYLYSLRSSFWHHALLPALEFFMKNGFKDEACSAFTKACMENYNAAVLAQIVQESDDEIAEAMCMTAAEADFPQAMVWHGDALVAKGRLRRAESFYQQATMKGLKEARIYLAQCYKLQGKLDQAAQEFSQALKDGINCYIEFGMLLEQMENFDQAMLCFRMAIDMGDKEAYEKLLKLLVKTGKNQEAEMLMGLAIRCNAPMEELFNHGAPGDKEIAINTRADRNSN